VQLPHLGHRAVLAAVCPHRGSQARWETVNRGETLLLAPAEQALPCTRSFTRGNSAARVETGLVRTPSERFTGGAASRPEPKLRAGRVAPRKTPRKGLWTTPRRSCSLRCAGCDSS